MIYAKIGAGWGYLMLHFVALSSQIDALNGRRQICRRIDAIVMAVDDDVFTEFGASALLLGHWLPMVIVRRS